MLTDKEQKEEDKFWKEVEKIAKSVDKWPTWKKEGWAILDRRDRYGDMFYERGRQKISDTV